MTNNDILRRIRYTFDLSDPEMISVFAAADCKVNREEVCAYLKSDEEEKGYKACSDTKLAYFLNGLINEKRGKKEGAAPEIEKELNNNIIFRKLKIALNLQAEEILEIIALADFELSKHELSALFRRPDHTHYRICQEQVLRKFLIGLQKKHRPST